MREPSSSHLKKPRSAAGKIFQRTAFSLLILIVVLAVLDFGAYLLLNSSPLHRITQSDQDLFYRLRPGTALDYRVGETFPDWWNQDAPLIHLAINSDGYRGPLVPRPKSLGEFRVICLGDSITFGSDVDEKMTYPAQLQRVLEQKYLGRKISVLNAGVPGYTSRQGLFLFKSKLMEYQPDAVIWGFGFNDHTLLPIVDNLDISLIPLEPGSDINRSLKKKALYWLWTQPLAQIIHSGIAPVFWRIRVAGLIPKLEDAKNISPLTQSPERFNRSRVPLFEWNIHLLEMNKLAQERHFQLIVVIFLGTPDLYRENAERFCSDHGVKFIAFSGLFARIIREGKLPDNNLYREMFKFYEKGLAPGALEKYPMLYITTDGLHPNDIGHHIISQNIAPALSPP